MRLILTVPAALAALAFAACTGETPKPTEPVTPAATPSATTHDMTAMDDSMKTADAADDTNTAETPADHTFHTYSDKVESVHLPVVAGTTWKATAVSGAEFVTIGEAKDEKMPDGTNHHVVKVTPKKPPNTPVQMAVVKFERVGADNAVAETRNISFMVH